MARRKMQSAALRGTENVTTAHTMRVAATSLSYSEGAEGRAKAGACQTAWHMWGRAQFNAGSADAYAREVGVRPDARAHVRQAQRAAHAAFAVILSACPPLRKRRREAAR